MAKAEPLLTSERITNDDGSASDYFVRYLQKMYSGGAQSVKIPVTSVNGKTGDVVITFDDIVEAGGIDYDKLNEKLQELLAGLAGVRTEIYTAIANLRNEDDPFDQYAFRTGFDYDIDAYLSYPPDDPITENGYDGFYVPHLTPGVASNAYSSTLTTGANVRSLQCLLFAVPRKFQSSSIGFWINGSQTNDAALNSQQWKIGLYECSSVDFTNTNIAPTISTTQRMRFPGKRVWQSTLLDTSAKAVTGNAAASTYVNPYYYLMNGGVYLAGTCPLHLRWDDSVVFNRGVYFIVISRVNTGTPANSNQIYSMRNLLTGQDSVNQGNYLKIFPAMKDPGYYTSIRPTGTFNSIETYSSFYMYNLASGYNTLPSNLADLYSQTTFNQVGGAGTVTFTDPMDGVTAATLNYQITNPGYIGGPVFTGRFL